MARWRGIIAFTGVETGDKRIIDSPVTWRALPLTMRAVFTDGVGGHENAEPVGTIDLIEERDDGAIYAEGEIAEGDPSAQRWANLLVQGAMRGVSIDPTAVDVVTELVNAESGEVVDIEGMSWEELDELLYGGEGDFYFRDRYSNLEIGALTAVGTPAFRDAVVEFVGGADDAGDAVAASAFASIDEVSVGDTVTWTDEDDEQQTGVIEEIDEEAEEVTVESGETLPVADVTVVDDDSDDDDDTEAATRRPALAALLRRQNSTRSPLVAASLPGHESSHGAVVTAAVAWDEGPPAAWFEQMDLDGPTPFTITDDGEVFGHIALWGSCHTGYSTGRASDCVMPEPSPTSYALFHANREVRCDDGQRVPVGVISMDTGHADQGSPGRRPAARTVVAHYDNTGTQAMNVRAYDDEHGIQVHGALAAGVTIEQVRRAMSSAPSGDWRDCDGNGLDMLGLLMVNVPGFPVYSNENGRTTVLMASLSHRAESYDSGVCQCLPESSNESASSVTTPTGASPHQSDAMAAAASLSNVDASPQPSEPVPRLSALVRLATAEHGDRPRRGANLSAEGGSGDATGSPQSKPCSCGKGNGGCAGSARNRSMNRGSIGTPASTTAMRLDASEGSSVVDATEQSDSGETIQPLLDGQPSGSNDAESFSGLRSNPRARLISSDRAMAGPLG